MYIGFTRPSGSGLSRARELPAHAIDASLMRSHVAYTPRWVWFWKMTLHIYLLGAGLPVHLCVRQARQFPSHAIDARLHDRIRRWRRDRRCRVRGATGGLSLYIYTGAYMFWYIYEFGLTRYIPVYAYFGTCMNESVNVAIAGAVFEELQVCYTHKYICIWTWTTYIYIYTRGLTPIRSVWRATGGLSLLKYKWMYTTYVFRCVCAKG